jgi:hypothetical protein
MSLPDFRQLSNRVCEIIENIVRYNNRLWIFGYARCDQRAQRNRGARCAQDADGYPSVDM